MLKNLQDQIQSKRTTFHSVPVEGYEDLPRLEAPAGYVYIFKDIEISQRYKIGRTNHPRRRLNNFGVKLPFKTEVIYIFRTNHAVDAERYLHDRYAKSRKRGEWFSLSPAQLAEIKQLGKPQNRRVREQSASRESTHMVQPAEPTWYDVPLSKAVRPVYRESLRRGIRIPPRNPYYRIVFILFGMILPLFVCSLVFIAAIVNT